MEEISYYGPALSVKFQDSFVYAACGPYIEKYDYNTGELLHKCRVFGKNKIHGLTFHASGFALLFGSRSVSIVNIETLDTANAVLEHEKITNEWIIDGQFSLSGNRVYLLTCYNKVLICQLDGTIVEVKAVKDERSILYSGTIKTISETQVVVCAGTVMGGVIVWDLLKELTLKNLIGHSGSIFHATISDDAKYVASCSDDRSIKLWDLTTGEEFSTAWGHTARIWKLKFFKNDHKLVSASEDCTCRIWNLQYGDNGEVKLEQDGIFEVHQNKNVWAVDIEENQMIAVTVGNDGRIKITDLLPTSRNDSLLLSYSMEIISKETGVALQKGEIIKGFSWLKFGAIAITSFGNILKLDESSQKWSFLYHEPKLESYSITNSLDNENFVVFCSSRGFLLFMSFDDTGKLLIKKDYNVEIFKITNCLITEQFSEEFMLVLESPNVNDKLTCVTFKRANFDFVFSYLFNRPDNFVCSSVICYQNYLLIGSRFSSIGVFSLTNTKLDPLTIRRLNSGDTTTQIKFVEKIEGNPVFMVTNRDGFYNFVEIKFPETETSTFNYKILQSNKVFKGFLEGAFFNDKNEFITYGFKSSLFYIYNETNSYEIATQLCGGAHRQWKLFRYKNKMVLMYVKASKFYTRNISNFKLPDTLKNGLHGRELRDISVSKHSSYRNGHLFVTGSEDTTIRLSHFNPFDGKITNYWLQRLHVSGLQRAKFINENYFISCSAREELFLWAIDDRGEKRPYIHFVQSIPSSSANPDLRIMDFDTLFLDDGNMIVSTVYSDSMIKLWHYSFQSETFNLLSSGRYETCCLLNIAIQIVVDQVLLIVTPTDGYVVIYDITNILPFAFDKKVRLDDGYKPGNQYPLPEYKTRSAIHKSAIKTFDSFVSPSTNSIIIVTGGDDNALAITELVYNSKLDSWNLNVQSTADKAASSTITSLNLFDNNTKILVTSVDQIVRVWDISNNKLMLKLERPVTVADTGSSDVIAIGDNTHIALIGGVGLSMWNLSL